MSLQLLWLSGIILDEFQGAAYERLLNALPGKLTQAEMLPNGIKAGFKVSCCLYHTLTTWQRKVFGLGPHERNQGKWGWLKRADGLGHLTHWSEAATSKDACVDALKVTIIFVFFSLQLRVSHMKKKTRQERALYKGIEATFVKPRIPHRFGNYVSSWAQNFQLSKVLLTPSKRQFSSSKKGSSARFRKKGQKTPCTSISSWKTTCQWVKWTRIRHIWIEFPSKYSWGPSLKDGVEEGWKLSGKSNAFFCRSQTLENTSKMSSGQAESPAGLNRCQGQLTFAPGDKSTPKAHTTARSSHLDWNFTPRRGDRKIWERLALKFWGREIDLFQRKNEL